MNKSDLEQLVREKLKDYLFLVVSNRQPYEHSLRKGKIQCRKTSGGVITALDPVMQACNGLWIAASSGESDRQVVDKDNKIRVPPENPSYTLKRLWLTKEEEEGYYYGYANDALWPLCHMAFQRPIFKQEDWELYKRVNEKFADSILEEIGDRKAFIWIQDYHLCLLPKMLKEKAGDNIITACFWHVPWPSYETFRVCPQKNEILDGLLANDLIGFHIHYHCHNFLDVIDRQLESKIDRERFSVVRNNRETLIRPYPISVDFEEINSASLALKNQKDADGLIEELGIGDYQIILGVDRIDYTKGIPERLYAMDRLLIKHPHLKKKVVFLQIGVLSRTHIQKYKDLNDELNMLIEQINWRHSVDGWKPIVFLRRNLTLQELLVLYRKAAVCIVSSLHDGMNLVAKEYVSARTEEDGVLILSQFTGSARELSDAVLVNPFDGEQFSESLFHALTMPAEEAKRRMVKMRNAVAENNIYRWAGRMISGLLKVDFKEV